MTPPIALVVHGHFYQPPRENPWTDEIPREPSAAPFHDWNARIHAECYRANAFARIHDGGGRIEAIVNNYDRLSFNFGPTLARWLERHDRDAQARIYAADAVQRRRLGHGGAMAQAYAHPIVPLLTPADRRTQLLWGLQDFRRRFGRDAEGLWLPETGVSASTLEDLIELGVKFTILAPEQIAAVRASPREAWQPVDRDGMDTGRAYYWRHRDGSGRRIAVAVFDGPLSRGVAFGETAARAETFLDAVRASADRSKADGQRLVLCASDGELWGHHKKFADLTLAFATHVEAARRGIEVTNLAAFLARHPPGREVQLAPGPDGAGTAWSCTHGLGRWQADCGCHMGGGPNWNQKWRAPLRRAVDLVRDASAAFYEDAGSELLVDPWGARDAYGEVIDDPVPARDRALLPFATAALAAGGDEARDRARLLLELQRATCLMYASCGWFFDDIAGLEATLVIRMAAHAMDLMRDAGGGPPVADVLAVLAEAKSNHAEKGTGADVFRRVAGDRVTPTRAIAHGALARLVSFREPVVPGFDVAFEGEQARGRTLVGRARAENRRTGARAEADFEAVWGPEGALWTRVDGETFTAAELGDDVLSELVLSSVLLDLQRQPDLRMARLVVRAARHAPPDPDTRPGASLRISLLNLLPSLLSDPYPLAAGAQLVSDLLDVVAMPPGSRRRRRLEELVSDLMDRGRPPASLRALAAKLGFAPAAAAVESKAAS